MKKLITKKGYNKISIWIGIIGEKISTCHLIISNSKFSNRLRLRKLDLPNVRRAVNFSYSPVGTIR